MTGATLLSGGGSAHLGHPCCSVRQGAGALSLQLWEGQVAECGLPSKNSERFSINVWNFMSGWNRQISFQR